jgi:hypothetical protein
MGGRVGLEVEEQKAVTTLANQAASRRGLQVAPLTGWTKRPGTATLRYILVFPREVREVREVVGFL